MAVTVTFLEPGTDATQDLTFWQVVNHSGTGSAPVSSATQAHTGLRSIKCVLAATGDQSYVASPDGAVSDAGTRVSFWFYFSAVPTTRTPIFQAETSGDGTAVFLGGLNTNGTLMVGGQNGASGIVSSGSTVLSANTWYRISFGYKVTSGTVWNYTLYLNGVSEITATNAGTLTTTGSSDWVMGASTSSGSGVPSSGAITMYFDDIYIDNGTDSADPGNISVTAKRPFANGTTNGFTTRIGAGGSGYGSGHAPQVNEQPLSVTNGWSVVASATTEEYNIEGLSVGDVNLTGATLLGVQGWLYAASTLTETTDKIVVDGTQTTLASVTSTNTLFVQNSATPTVYPAGTGSDIGMVSSAAATTKLFEAGVLVAYIPSTASPFLPYQPQYFLAPAQGY